MKNPFLRRGVSHFAVAEPMAVKSSQPTSGPLIALQLTSGAQWTPREFTSLAREGYARNPVAYRCIRMISEAAASVSLCACQRIKQASRA